MGHDDRLIVLGDERRPPEFDTEAKPARSPLWALVPAAGILLGLMAFIVIPQDEAETRTAPAGIATPAPPATSPDPAPGAASERVVVEAVLVDLVGSGTVTSVAHGPDGWLAVSAGPPVIAHTSDDGVRWEAVTLQGVVGREPVAAVGDGVMVVVGSHYSGWSDRRHVVGAMSNDDGATWTPISHIGSMVVRDVAVVDGRIFVGGTVGLRDWFGWGDLGTAALWELVEGDLIGVELSSAHGPSEVRSIVDTPRGVRAYGFTAEGPAAWTLDGGGAGLSLPTTGEFQRFVVVADAGDRLLALIGRADFWGGNSVWESKDGLTWTDPGRAPGVPVTDIAVNRDGAIVAPLAADQSVWIEGFGIVDLLERTGGSSHLARSNGVTTADGLVVLGGDSEQGPFLIVQGAQAPPIEVAAPIPDGRERWRPQLTIDLRVVGLGDSAWPLGAFADDDAGYLFTTTRLYEIDTSRPGLLVSPMFEGSFAGGSGEFGTWIASTDRPDRSKLRIREDAVWTWVDVPLSAIVAAGTLGDVIVVSGWGVGGPEILQLGGDGAWTPLGPPDQEVEHVLPVGHGLVGQGEWLEDVDAPQALYSRDGSTWEPIEGWSLHRGVGLHVMLRSMADPSTVAFPESAPTPQPIEIPTDSFDVSFARWDGRLVVQDPWTVFLQEPSGEWTVLPVDQEHGVTGPAVAIPGPTPRLASIDHGLLTFLVWS